MLDAVDAAAVGARRDKQRGEQTDFIRIALDERHALGILEPPRFLHHLPCLRLELFGRQVGKYLWIDALTPLLLGIAQDLLGCEVRLQPLGFHGESRDSLGEPLLKRPFHGRSLCARDPTQAGLLFASGLPRARDKKGSCPRPRRGRADVAGPVGDRGYASYHTLCKDSYPM